VTCSSHRGAPWGAVGMDYRALTVTIGLTLLTTLVFGLVPALHATRLDVQAALAEGGTRSVACGSRGWSRRLLVVAEVALGVVLLVGAGLLIRTFVHLPTQSPGFDTQQLVMASASLEDARYDKHESVEQLFERSLARLAAVPGVESAAVSLGLPYERILKMGTRVIGAGGEQSDFVFSTATYVKPRYFETLRLPLLQGHTLAATDTKTSAPAVVINEVFARRYFKNQDAVGGRVRMNGLDRQVVGVVGNVRQRAGFNGFGPLDALPSVYMPFAQFGEANLRTIHGWFSTAWIVREARPGAVTGPVLRRTMAEVDSLLAVSGVRGVGDVRGAALVRQRMLMTLVAVMGGVALLLAAIGLHGLIASGVTERTREFGIRMARGATAGQTIREAAMPGVWLALAGLVVGCGVAAGVSGLIRTLLWGVKPNDPLTFAVVVGTLLMVAVAASVLPALRVKRLDPVSLLRAE